MLGGTESSVGGAVESGGVAECMADSLEPRKETTQMLAQIRAESMLDLGDEGRVAMACNVVRKQQALAGMYSSRPKPRRVLQYAAEEIIARDEGDAPLLAMNETCQRNSVAAW